MNSSPMLLLKWLSSEEIPFWYRSCLMNFGEYKFHKTISYVSYDFQKDIEVFGNIIEKENCLWALQSLNVHNKFVFLIFSELIGSSNGISTCFCL